MRPARHVETDEDWSQTSRLVIVPGGAVETKSPIMNIPTNSTPLPVVAVIYCDGSCLGNPGPGGWAALIRIPGMKEQLISGSVAQTTNNRMEIQAAIEALLTLPAGSKAQVITDSNYVVKGMSEWRFKWIQQGWMTANRKPVANADLWQALHSAATKVEATWKWVRGHSGNEGNEKVDKAARKAASKFQEWSR